MSILNRTAGRPEIRFAQREWLEKYLPGRANAIDSFVASLRGIGVDIDADSSARYAYLPLAEAERHASVIAEAVLNLA